MSFPMYETGYNNGNIGLTIKGNTKASFRKEWIKLFNIVDVRLTDNFGVDTFDLFQKKRERIEISIMENKCKYFLEELETMLFLSEVDKEHLIKRYKIHFNKYLEK